MAERFSESYFGLILDDLRCLPDRTTWFSLLRELLLPSGDELAAKYGQEELRPLEKKIRLPLLYARYLLVGLLKRVVRLQ
ncbi:MAG: hypothetical protein ACL93V_13825 [Candidatus Electrothrix sp. YB6]